MLKRSYKKIVSAVSFAVLLGASVNAVSMTAGEGNFSPYVDNKGNISLPNDFRVGMVHLGSWFVPEGGASGFHDVYTERASAEAYRKTGKFPDGATLVKELRGAKVGDYTTGKGVNHAVSGVKQWFVMIKDAKGRFPGNKIWGDGWGWALYKPDDKSKQLAVDYKVDCLSCHLPAKDTDLVYVEAYPTLTK